MFHQGIQTRENGMDNGFIVFECLVPLMTHEKRVVYITSQTKTFHWLFNLLSANGGPMKVICFCLCEQWR